MTEVISITPKEILSIDRFRIWDIAEAKYIIHYDDGVDVKSTKKRIIFNRYCWDLFTLYPQTPIISSCDVDSILKGEMYNADTHIKLLETIFKHICSFNGIHSYSQKEPLLRLTYNIVNNIYNEIVQRASTHVFTIDAVDFIEVVKLPKIEEIHRNIKPYPDSVENAYKQIKTLLNNTPLKNRFIKAYRSKAINENQANQCIGPRGFVTDLDRSVFRQPIINGFIKGMGNLFEIMAESRTAAKSLNANDQHIKDSEYASRRLQLLSMVVEAIENTDCGSTEYMELYVTPVVLENIKGKYYLKEDGTLDYIRGDEKHLINSFIKVRTGLGCKLPNPKHICTTCLGKVSENFKENSNIGYTMVSYLMEKTTQSILSTKHLTHSVKKVSIKLEGNANKYFYIDSEHNIYFNKDIDLRGLYFILPTSKMGNLVDVLNTKSNNIALNKVGELDVLFIRDTKHKTPQTETVVIEYKDRKAIITRQFLNYIKNIQMDTDTRGNFIIPLEAFDKTQPVFSIPLKEEDIMAFLDRVVGIVENNKDKIDNPYEKLNMLFMEVTEKFKCNLSVLEVIIYASTTYNSYNNDYRLGRNSPHVRTETKTNIFKNRSFSQLAVFEEQTKAIISDSVRMFDSSKRIDHPLDVLFTPQDIVK